MSSLRIGHKKAALAFILGSTGLVACTSGWSSYDEPYYGYRDPSSSSSSSSGSHGNPYREAGTGYGEDGRWDANNVFPAECVDPNGFGGRGCFRCKPKTNEELLNACTTSHFETFDNFRRVTNFDVTDPRPALPTDLPPAPAPYAGETPGDPTDTLPPAPACPLGAKPNPVMVLGATGFPLETIAKAMGTSATIFFLEKGSCDGVAGMLLNAPKLSGEVVYFDTDGTKNRCMLSGSHPADITTSTLFASTCAGQSGLSEQVSLPSNVEDFLGPANTVMFTVPATSKERVISAEAAYKVYGFGPRSGVAPWTGEEAIYRRRSSSGNQQTVALSLGLPPDALRGRDSNGSSNMLSALRNAPFPDNTLGFSSSEIVDPNRDVVKSLAYQHFQQAVAFYPDSDPANFDRRNVRDGHYYMWLPLHVMARTSGGEPVSVANEVLDPAGTTKAARDAAVKRLVYVMISRQEPPVKSVDLLGALKRTGNVPPCAMHVQRAREAAPLEPYSPRAACGCAFEASAPGTTAPECKPCGSSRECPSTSTCSFGYCEAR